MTKLERIIREMEIQNERLQNIINKIEAGEITQNIMKSELNSHQELNVKLVEALTIETELSK